MIEVLTHLAETDRDDFNAICRAIVLHDDPTEARERVLDYIDQGTPMHLLGRFARLVERGAVDRCELQVEL